MKKTLLLGAIALTPFLFGSTDITWDGGASPNTNWDTTGNWSGGAVPNSPGQAAIFGDTGISDGVVIHLQSDINIDQVTSSATQPFEIDSTGGHFVFATTSTNPQFSITNGQLTISSDISLNASTALGFNVAGDTSCILTGNVVGSGTNLTKSGNGVLSLSGTTTSTGNTTIAGGTLITPISGIPGNVIVESNANLTFNSPGTFNYTVTGPGSISIDVGTGNTFTFGGSNNCTGGTNIISGSLGYAGQSKISQDVNIDAGAYLTVILSPHDVVAVTGKIQGAGTLRIKPPAQVDRAPVVPTVILEGDNSYDTTEIDTAVNLQGTTSSLQGTITNPDLVDGVTVILDQSTDGDFTAVLGEVPPSSEPHAAVRQFKGSLLKRGIAEVTMSNDFSLTAGGTLTVERGAFLLHGNNAVSGRVDISSGRFEQTGPFQGGSEVRVHSGGRTVFDNRTNLASPAMTTIEGLITVSDGDFTSAGAFNFNGGVTMTGGSFTAAATSQSTIFSPFNMTGGVATLSGPIDINQLTMSGGSFSFLGVTEVLDTINVSGGTLTVDGAITVDNGPLVVGESAILKGTGSITNGVNLYGTLSPGHSPGTITFSGNSSFETGSTILIDVTPTQHDLINITSGTLTIDSGVTLTVHEYLGTYSFPFMTKIIDVTSGINGHGVFDHVTSTLPLFDVSLLYDSNDVFLVMNALPFTSLISSGNAGQVASCLDSFNPPAGSDMEFVISELRLASNAEQLTKALNQLQPSQYTALALAQQEATLSLETTIDKRLIDRKLSCSKGKDNLTLWATIFAATSRQVKAHQQPGYTTSGPGVFVGLDQGLFNHLTLGGGLGYTQNAMNWSGNQGHATIHSGYASLYGRYERQHVFLQGSLMGAISHFKTDRHIYINMSIPIDRHAHAAHQGYEGVASLKGGYNFNVGRTTFTPFIDASYLYTYERGFKERGAESLNLNVESKRSNLIYSEAGLKLSRCGKYNEKITLMPFLELSVIRESRFHGAREKANFYTCYLDVTGLNPSRILAGLSAGLNMTLGREEEGVISLYYKGRYNNSFQENDAFLQLGWNF